MSPDDGIIKDGKTETSSTGSISAGCGYEDDHNSYSSSTNLADDSSNNSQKKRRWRIKRLIQKLSFERNPTPPPSSQPSSSQPVPTTAKSTRTTPTLEPSSDHHPSKEGADPETPVHVIPVLHGTLDPEGEVEVIFYDAHQDGDDSSQNFHGKFQRESIVLSHIQRGGSEVADAAVNASSANTTAAATSNPYYVEVDTDESQAGAGDESYPYHPATPLNDANPPREVTVEHNTNLPPKVLPAPLPPKELPLRFLRAGKGDPEEGLRRYEQTLAWRQAENIDEILREANPNFDVIKQHYKHYCHGKGKNGEPCYYEQPPKTNLKALRDAGVNLETLLRHYIQVTEFQWQFLERDDLRRSIYIIDVEGMRLGDFVGEVVDFVKRASKLSNLHYPERAGYGTWGDSV